MMKAEPVADVTRNTHNYFAQGGNELVIGGKLTFLPGAIIEGGDDLFAPVGAALTRSHMCPTARRPPLPR